MTCVFAAVMRVRPERVTLGSTIDDTKIPPRPGRFFNFKAVSRHGLGPYETKGAGLGKILGYARISTDQGQDISTQKAKLEELGAVVVFADIGNGSSLTGRDQLEAAIRLLEPHDELLALHPDRLARDTGDLLTIAKRVVERGAILRVNDPAIRFDGTDML